MTRQGQGRRTDQRILVADPDTVASQRLAQALREQDYAVETLSDAQAVVDVVERATPDLVILEIALPTARVGWEVLARLRALAVPVIVCTDKASEAERVAALELGADDCLSKQVSHHELAAHVRAVLRRSDDPAELEQLAYDGLVVDVRARKVFVDGREVAVRPREFDLLAFLARSPGQVFSRDQLLEHVWGSQPGWQDPETVTEHVRRLRLAMEADPRRPRWLITVRGVGYRFEA